MVELEKVEADEDVAELRELIEKHRDLHRLSTVAADVLDRWDEVLPQFVKVMPTDYKRVLRRTRNGSRIAGRVGDEESHAKRKAQEARR